MDQAMPLDATAPIGEQVLVHLRGRIIRGDLAPGQRLSEQEIAGYYGLSRQPVREAFIRLEAENLLEIRPQRGTYVKAISLSSVKSARFVREAVEADIIRLVCARTTRSDVAGLRDQVAAQRRIGIGNTFEFMKADELFHRTLSQIAGTMDAWGQLQSLKTHMDRVRFLTAAEYPTNRVIAQHAEIVEALAAADENRAEAAMRQHLREVLTDLVAIIAAQPHHFDTSV